MFSSNIKRQIIKSKNDDTEINFINLDFSYAEEIGLIKGISPPAINSNNLVGSP